MRLSLSLSLSVLALLASRCSTGDRGEDVGTSSSRLITAAPNNHPIQGTFYGHHEISTGYVAGCFFGYDVCGRWISTWNTGTGNKQLGWSQSLDPYGLNWSPQQQQQFDQFGNPGPSPYNGMPFTGWASDSSVAPATNQLYNNSNKRMLVSNVASSGTGQQNAADDVVIAFSDDAGLSWQNASYVDVPGPGGGGGRADGPHLVSNPVAPWDLTDPLVSRRVSPPPREA
jgi:hypothetical protein